MHLFTQWIRWTREAAVPTPTVFINMDEAVVERQPSRTHADVVSVPATHNSKKLVHKRGHCKRIVTVSTVVAPICSVPDLQTILPQFLLPKNVRLTQRTTIPRGRTSTADHDRRQ